MTGPLVSLNEYFAGHRRAVEARLKQAPSPPRGEMNKTEARYAEHLRGMRLGGQVSDFLFEPIRLKLARGLYYTPDFLVIVSHGLHVRCEFHEVKTWWRGKVGTPGRAGWTEDSRVKIKAAAQLFPWFRFRAAVLRGGAFEMEDFRPTP